MICHCMCATYGSVTSTWKASLFRNWNYSLHVLHFIHSSIIFSYIWKQKECRYLEFTTSFNLKMSISAFTYLLQNWMWIQSDEFHQIFFFTHEKKLSKKKLHFMSKEGVYLENEEILRKNETPLTHGNHTTLAECLSLLPFLTIFCFLLF